MRIETTENTMDNPMRQQLEPPGDERERNVERISRYQRRIRFRTDIPFKDAKRELVEPFEREYLVDLLRAHGGNLSACSRASGLSRKYLRQLLEKHGIEEERERLARGTGIHVIPASVRERGEPGEPGDHAG